MKGVSYTLMFIFSTIFNSAFAQQSWFINIPDKTTSFTYTARIDSSSYWIIQGVASGKPVTGSDILHITVMDECGYVNAFELTSDSVYSFINIINTFVQNDSLFIAIAVNPKFVHYHRMPSLLGISLHNYGARMSFQIADNVNYLLSYQPLGNERYMTYNFLSYTEKPSQYALMIVNKDFQVLNYFENFTEYTISGHATRLANGFVFSTSTKLVGLDENLDMLWGKELPSGYFMSQFHKTQDGFLATYRNRYSSLLAIAKFDNNGNVQWVSPELVPVGYKLVKHFSLSSSNDVQIVAITAENEQSPGEVTLLLYKIDVVSGKILSINQSVSLPAQLSLWQIFQDIYDNLFVAIQANNGIAGLININNSEDCNVNIERSFSLNQADIHLNPMSSTVQSLQDHFDIGFIPLRSIPSQTDIGAYCDIKPQQEMLQPVYTLCEGEELKLDLSQVKYNIKWENGSREKARTINKPGIYSYSVDHCAIQHTESVEVLDGRCGNVFIPNIFSPDQDGNNDELQISASFDVRLISMSIYDRWGEEVYNCSGETCSWDGRFKGKGAPSGVYVAVVKYSNHNGEKTKSASVTLIR